MNNSNWTGRWNRTSRDAYGYSLQQEPHLGEVWVGRGSLFLAGFVFGLIVCGVI